jgi:hypothetical protein
MDRFGLLLGFLVHPNIHRAFLLRLDWDDDNGRELYDLFPKVSLYHALVSRQFSYFQKLYVLFYQILDELFPSSPVFLINHPDSLVMLDLRSLIYKGNQN